MCVRNVLKGFSNKELFIIGVSSPWSQDQNKVGFKKKKQKIKRGNETPKYVIIEK